MAGLDDLGSLWRWMFLRPIWKCLSGRRLAEVGNRRRGMTCGQHAGCGSGCEGQVVEGCGGSGAGLDDEALVVAEGGHARERGAGV
jgi:hypothetical protein